MVRKGLSKGHVEWRKKKIKERNEAFIKETRALGDMEIGDTYLMTFWCLCPNGELYTPVIGDRFYTVATRVVGGWDFTIWEVLDHELINPSNSTFYSFN